VVRQNRSYNAGQDLGSARHCSDKRRHRLLHVDRHLLHDLGGSRDLLDLKSRGLKVHSPELTFATPDHAISTGPARAGTIKIGQELLAALRTDDAGRRRPLGDDLATGAYLLRWQRPHMVD